MTTTKRQIRLRYLSAFIIVVAGVFIVRLYQIQIREADKWAETARSQYVHNSPYAFNRGKIFFTSKDGDLYEAANITSGWLVSIKPAELKDPEGAYRTIAQIDSDVATDSARTLFFDRAKKPAKEVEVYHRVPDSLGQAIADSHIPGVIVRRETWRAYPMGSLASQVVGYLGHTKAADDTDVYAGQYGIEKQYEDILVRDDSSVKVSAFAQLFGDFGQVSASQKNEQGDIVLTIEPQVQKELEKTLANVEEVWHSKQVGGIVMDPHTGAILAMGALPSFDPNDYGNAKDVSVFRNPLVQDRMEMGSIIKPLTMATGLDTGSITPNSTYTDVGCRTVNKKTFCNFDHRGRGPGTTMQDILSNSLNIGVAYITGQIGHEKFRNYFVDKLQLGSATGIDLPNELHGLVDNITNKYADRRDIEFYTASFGQGISMSPVTTAAALATLGNGGILVTPHVGKAIVYPDGTSRELTLPPTSRVFSQDTSTNVTRMLVNVVEDKLMYGAGVDPNHRIAAKTGTAQIAGGNGKYDEEKWLHTFMAYSPAYDPKFVIFLFNREPKHVDYASQTLGKPSMDLMKFLLNYYSVPPDRNPTQADFDKLEKNKRIYEGIIKAQGLPY